MAIACLQLQTVTYGLKAFTCLGTKCLIELTYLYQDQNLLAAEVLRLNTYIDDVFCGADSEEFIQELKIQLIKLMKIGNVNLHKWCSNSPESLNDLPYNRKYFEHIDLNKDNIIQTLGLKYNIIADTLIFSCPMTHDMEIKG